ncbi:hypothetical protein THAOC_15120, partial [Thalassiosira oceanica]
MASGIPLESSSQGLFAESLYLLGVSSTRKAIFDPSTRCFRVRVKGRYAHESDAPVAHPRPGYCSRSITWPPAVDRRRWFGRDWCNGRGIRPDRGSPRPAVLALPPARSITTQHILNPPLRRYGRSGARGSSIYLGRELDAATSIPDSAAD